MARFVSASTVIISTPNVGARITRSGSRCGRAASPGSPGAGEFAEVDIHVVGHEAVAVGQVLQSPELSITRAEEDHLLSPML